MENLLVALFAHNRLLETWLRKAACTSLIHTHCRVYNWIYYDTNQTLFLILELNRCISLFFLTLGRSCLNSVLQYGSKRLCSDIGVKENLSARKMSARTVDYLRFKITSKRCTTPGWSVCNPSATWSMHN